MGGAADIVVAGAGAIGSAVALMLARAGRRVTLVDPAPMDAGASGIAAGMLAPAFETLFDGGSRDRFQLLAAARDLWPPLARSVGLRLDQRGALAVGSPGEARDWAEQLAAVGVSARAASQDEVRAAAPAMSAGVVTEEDWRLEPRAALDALRRGAAAAGARFL